MAETAKFIMKLVDTDTGAKRKIEFPEGIQVTVGDVLKTKGLTMVYRDNGVLYASVHDVIDDPVGKTLIIRDWNQITTGNNPDVILEQFDYVCADLLQRKQNASSAAEFFCADDALDFMNRVVKRNIDADIARTGSKKKSMC